MAKRSFSTFAPHEPTIKGTSQGKKPITSTMNKHKRRTYQKVQRTREISHGSEND